MPNRTTMRHVLLLTALLTFLVPATAQTREKKVSPSDFPALVKEASAAFEAEKFSEAVDKLRAAMRVAMEALEKKVVAAMPQPPEGFQVQSKRTARTANAYGMMFPGSAGMPIEHSYTGPKGANVKISCVLKSPLVQMMTMAFNLARNDPSKEVIGYGKHKGLLEKKNDGQRLQLQIVIDEKHLVTVSAWKVSEETLFKMADQALVDRLASLLGD